MLKLFVKTIIFSVLFLGITSTSYSKDPLQFIKEVTGDASSILKNEISKEQKIEKKQFQLLLAINPQTSTGIFTTITKQEA